MKFSTTLKCEGCVATITEDMNALAGAENWSVDLSVTPKILTVTNDDVSEEEVVEVIEDNGFEAVRI